MAATVSHENQWRFDAIDLRAGMAIALWRKPRNTAHGVPHDHTPALFFSPPHFQPEPVVNIAVALSACRGTFEPGLYLEGSAIEASFATPDEVGEFMRRAYVGGAGGDGTDGGGEPGPVPPPPEDDGGWREPFFFHESPFVTTLTKRIQDFQEVSTRIPEGKSFLFPWTEPMLDRDGRWLDSPPADAADGLALVSAGLVMIDEMLRRMPPLADASMWLTWYDDVRELAGLLGGTGVAAYMLQDPYRDALKVILSRSRLTEREDMSDEWRLRLGWLFLFGPAVSQPRTREDLQDALWELDNVHHYLAGAWSPPLAARLEDPLDTLSRLPLPQVLHCMLPEDARSKASLYHLLNVMVAEPQAACCHAGVLPFAVTLTLFAAACLVAPRTNPAFIASFRLHAAPPSVERIRRTAEQGRDWLLEHLPKHVYAERYETLLGRSKSLRYAAPPAATPHTSYTA